MTIWKKKGIRIFCTLFCLIIVAVPLKESLPVSKVFFQSGDQSHQRMKLRFPSRAYEHMKFTTSMILIVVFSLFLLCMHPPSALILHGN